VELVLLVVALLLEPLEDSEPRLPEARRVASRDERLMLPLLLVTALVDIIHSLVEVTDLTVVGTSRGIFSRRPVSPLADAV
jgi:hypothetical protein